MSNLKEIISELQRIIEEDADVKAFCNEKYGKDIHVEAGEFRFSAIPIKNIPVAIVSDGFDESEKRRFLFSEHEANLVITCGILQKNVRESQEELIQLKDHIKSAVKKDPLLSGLASYSTVTKSRRLKAITNPLNFMELTVYVNFKAV
ncbi:hypothetical protein ACFL2A_00610 [Thermodesulfobacteriota bacterium]